MDPPRRSQRVPEEELKSEFNREVARTIIPSNFPSTAQVALPPAFARLEQRGGGAGEAPQSRCELPGLLIKKVLISKIVKKYNSVQDGRSDVQNRVLKKRVVIKKCPFYSNTYPRGIF